MSDYYNPKRTKNLYDPGSETPFKVSRSKIELFIECPRCFYLDRRMGTSRPPGYPFSLNSAVDALLKKEFDIYRGKGKPHPLMKAYGVDAVPLAHDSLDEWRNNFRGVQHLHKATNLLIFGAVDDVWTTQNGELIVVDYKSTSKQSEVNLDADWQDGYKRQMEIYQWLLRQNGFKVSDTGYFVYCNGKTDKKAFDGKLEFDISLLPYTGDGNWIESSLKKMSKCLNSSKVPKQRKECDYCNYAAALSDKYGY